LAATIQIPTTFTAVDKFSKVVSNMTRGVKSFGNSAQASISRFDNKVNNSFKKIGSLGLLIGGLTLGTIFTSAFRDVTEFETGLVGVSKTTGIIGPELKQLGSDIVQTSRDLRVIPTKKLLELSQSAGQLGVTGSENILKFATTLAKLEGASDIEGEQGAAAIARLLTLTGEGVGVVDQFSSSLVALGNASAATESEILGVSSEVARATAAYKLNSTEILGIATTLKSLDVRPEAAGTAIGKVFRGIEMATIEGGAKLQNFGKVMGMTSAQVQEAFAKSPRQAFDFFIKGLDRIDKSGGSVAKALSDVGLSGETVSKGIIPLATNYDLLQEKMALANQGFKENTALGNEFDAASNTVQKSLDSIKIGFTNVMIAQATAGSGLAVLQDIFFYLGENMETVVLVGASLIGLFVLLKAAVLAATVITGAYNIALGINTAITQNNKRAIIGNTIATNAYKVAMAVGTGVTWLATAATTAFGIALNLGLWPILAIIAAVVAVILVIKNWSAITEWFGKKWEMFTNWISDSWDRVVKFFSEFDFKGMFVQIGQSIMTYLLMPIKMLLMLLAKLPGKVGDLAQMGLDKIGGLTGEIGINNEDGVGDDGVLPSTNQSSSDAVSRSVSKNNLNIKIKDKGGNIEEISQTGDDNIPINVSNTVGAF
jgi:TP901 family phage tail tape measure protein